jgi:hypothetical protein
MTASRLAREAQAVLMDLRGLKPKNRGCIFEIEQLIASVPLRRIVLLTDGSTDFSLLEQRVRERGVPCPAAPRMPPLASIASISCTLHPAAARPSTRC